MKLHSVAFEGDHQHISNLSTQKESQTFGHGKQLQYLLVCLDVAAKFTLKSGMPGGGDQTGNILKPEGVLYRWNSFVGLAALSTTCLFFCTQIRTQQTVAYIEKFLVSS